MTLSLDNLIWFSTWFLVFALIYFGFLAILCAIRNFMFGYDSTDFESEEDQ